MYPVTKDFLGKPAPPGYVAGLGRGATGFTTRSDIGPARETKQPSKPPEKEDEDEKPNEGGLFSNAPYEEDDEEADQIWEQIDKQMDRKHRAKTEAEGPTIEEQLRGYKRQLEGMSAEEWESIPDVAQVAETAARAKRRRKVSKERYSVVSDSSLVGIMGQATDFAALSEARDSVLKLKLDQVGDSASGKTTVDPRGYLTSLNTLKGAEIGDISRARMLLKSVVQTNPKHAPGWIAAARLEELANKPARARTVITEGCENCPQNEDVWLEAARLNKRDARLVLASAARHLPLSVRVWMAAADLEPHAKEQKRVLRRALELIPTSVALWKRAVALEEPEDARVLLSHAVELVPQSTELWLALARLETPENARKVLNRARRSIPTSHEVWVCAAKLEEQGPLASAIMRKAIPSLVANGSMVTREMWFAIASECEHDGYPRTSEAIVGAAASLGFDVEDADEDRVNAWVEDAERLAHKKSVVTARAIFKCALDVMPTSAELWQLAAELEERGEALDNLLRRAVQSCPQSETLWLMLAKERWTKGDVSGARAVLDEAFRTNPQEATLLAAVKLESETEQYPRALALLSRGRAHQFGSTTGTARIWLKSAALLRQIGELHDALGVAKEGLQNFPKAFKLWLIRSQLEAQLAGPKDAQRTLSLALKQCPQSVELWVAAARLETQVPRARAILERARVYIPKSPRLWLESVLLETDQVARPMLSRALRECSSAGVLWAHSILLEPPVQRKAKSTDALKAAGSDPYVLVMVARLFWHERRLDKARRWFERAAKADPDCGDSWAWWLRFELVEAGGHVEVENQCAEAQPRHGLVWPAVAKDPANARLSTKDILHKVAKDLESARQL
ncbi:U4/U6 x U5 tri-snRNP complex subunit Prp1 [Coemansia spiralis]|uniref:U4/U6 x U5 tri-snRNP complex subunit Prp1 n=2 Tax=Coemansia TaxID=4863 RepID=A0A9W8G796_9FUNG|nr:PRP1 splicing factor, N-terminal-domain-containing protein [Coemansia spiralis]KAJ1992135.1 U4/U6 x U5 tri-snRNP complex subunit Prp1 [Coemansia umbellata]KAJ2622045.1 U4/U6 x U5 tri-snRNP complex subunit Prp1 [Coemansia sp. RSA 1358]KAJ2677649.1 U4/U6 x U5 tri-snRNP complex subunit Prp1 [Coemansia spiralis]